LQFLCGTTINLENCSLHVEYIDWHSDAGRDVYEYYICKDKHKIIDMLTATVEAKLLWLENHLRGVDWKDTKESPPVPQCCCPKPRMACFGLGGTVGRLLDSMLCSVQLHVNGLDCWYRFPHPDFTVSPGHANSTNMHVQSVLRISMETLKLVPAAADGIDHESGRRAQEASLAAVLSEAMSSGAMRFVLAGSKMKIHWAYERGVNMPFQMGRIGAEVRQGQGSVAKIVTTNTTVSTNTTKPTHRAHTDHTHTQGTHSTELKPHATHTHTTRKRHTET
jgi:hypothetical protein